MLDKPIKVNLENCDGVVFVNYIIGESLQGILWLWFYKRQIVKTVGAAPGCIQANAGLMSWRSAMMVTYWKDRQSLMAFMGNKNHKGWVSYASKFHEHITLCNEIYPAPDYVLHNNEPNGFALVEKRRLEELDLAPKRAANET